MLTIAPNRTIQVAVGILWRAGQVLISQRTTHQHLAGLWEFPGGKLEQNESVTDALARELKEELGITVLASQYWMDCTHDYGDKHIHLIVHQVHLFEGEPSGLEGQAIRWIAPHAMCASDFPAADKVILQRLEQLNR